MHSLRYCLLSSFLFHCKLLIFFVLQQIHPPLTILLLFLHLCLLQHLVFLWFFLKLMLFFFRFFFSFIFTSLHQVFTTDPRFFVFSFYLLFFHLFFLSLFFLSLLFLILCFLHNVTLCTLLLLLVLLQVRSLVQFYLTGTFL